MRSHVLPSWTPAPRDVVLLLVAVALGIVIARIDASPGWDDTGVIAGALVLASAVLAYLSPLRSWLLALAVGVWIPGRALLAGEPGMLAVLLLPALGAFAGAWLGRRTTATPR